MTAPNPTPSPTPATTAPVSQSALLAKLLAPASPWGATKPWMPGYQPQYTLPGQWGMLQPGNIDLKNRPIVPNPAEGGISTVRTITVTGPGGKAWLLPTAVNGKIVSNQQAIDHWRQTGQHLGVFQNENLANRYSVALHNQQAKLYGG